MGNITEICNQTASVVSSIEAGQVQEQQFVIVEMPAAPEHLQEEIAEFRQQEEFRDFCANKNLKRHRTKEEYYLGDWEGSSRKGRGLIYSPGEYLYYGDVDQVAQGSGTLKLYRQNILIEGQMRQGMPEGKCSIRDLNGLYTFEGLINSQQLPTSGRFQISNQTTPEKSYEIRLDDYPHNKATINFNDGCQYVGEISFDSLLPNGIGEEHYINGATYNGGWENGKYHGEGRFAWPDGSSYAGQYVQGLKEGTGNYTYVSGRVYKGDWANGRQEGRGVLFSPEGKVLKRGIWANGAFQREEEAEEEIEIVEPVEL